MFVLMLALAAATPQVDYARQIDRTFVCPESLPDKASRKAALDLFTRQAIAEGANTPARIVDLRLTMLRRHGCTKTLNSLER